MTTQPVNNWRPFHRIIPPLVVLLSQMALVAVIYWPTLQVAFVSDAWVYLDRLRVSVWATLTTATGYHYQPVGIAWIALIRAVLGENAGAFQAVSMAQLGLLSYSTFQLGRRLLPDAGTAFLGSLLLIGNAAFYEASYWALAGNVFVLAAQLYVLAVILAVEMASGRLVRTGPWLLGLTTFAAIFTHPAMVTVLPVSALTLFLVGDLPGDKGWSAAWVQKGKALLALAAAALPLVLSRFAFADNIALGPQPALGQMQAYWLVTRGLVAVFSLRGSHDVVHGLMTLGTYADFSTSRVWVYVVGWLVVGVLAAAICWWRTRSPGVRVLVSLLAIHVIVVAIAGGMSSRESLLPSVPAALLTAWAFRAIAERLAAIVPTVAGALVCRQLPAVGVLMLITAAGYDHRLSAAVHIRASNLSRALVAKVKEVAPAGHPPVDLTLINMPGHTVEYGIGAATFSNGLSELVRMTAPSAGTPQRLQLSIPSAPADFASESLLVTPEALKALLLEPSRVTLLFEMPSDFRVLTPESLDALTRR